MAGVPVWLDPVFSRRLGGAYRSHRPPPFAIGELPPPAAVLVSHNHYDHLDEATLAQLPSGTPVLCPRGLGRWLARRGHRPVELGWWQSTSVGGLRVTFVPARHWSRRGVLDTNRSWWGGWVVEGGGRQVYHAGDSAWFDGFAEIGGRFPGLDLALIPIGAYEPAWFMERNHLNPEQAGQAFLDVGARTLVPTHWGVFQLTDEPLVEPLERLRSWWRRAGPRDGRRLRPMAVGETVILDDLVGGARDLRGRAPAAEAAR